MNILSHILGFPRIGVNRELKKAQENYWQGKYNKKKLLSIGYKLRKKHWKKQLSSGLDFITVGDFSWYDHVLNTTMLLGNIPDRHKNYDNSIDIDTLFRIARGTAPTGHSTSASEMTKWFNTNYHYIVPEFKKDQDFNFSWSQIIEEVDEALSLGYIVKPVILGPLTYLWLGKKTENNSFDVLDLLKKIVPIYIYILKEFKKRNIEWVQIDEPILVLDLPKNWLKKFYDVYKLLHGTIKILLTTYFGSISHNIKYINDFFVDGIHIDLIHGDDNIFSLNSKISQKKTLSLGIINGRNVWKSNLDNWFDVINNIKKSRNKLWLGSSCSLLHTPIDLNYEKKIDSETKSWFSFAIQKCEELSLLRDSLNSNNKNNIEDWVKPINARELSTKVNKHLVSERVQSIRNNDLKRTNTYNSRYKLQNKKIKLPILPTTTIGSFPQTKEIRNLRMDFKKGVINQELYDKKIRNEIKKNIKIQEKIDIDVLVHGEPERNDMVEYFGEKLNGFTFTSNGWVQSYGSRCVKPPIIIGDIYRSKPITIDYAKYAQSLTKKPVKGMLTGPVTILFWSFPREDISKKIIAKQIALALRDEVLDLENAGIKIIQIDEPALREGLPLRKNKWKSYLKWSVDAFRLSSSVVKDETQIHTHMCYCEFSDIMNAIVNLDADVITLETARTNIEILEKIKNFQYPNSIGPGIYDIHSPNIPKKKEILILLNKYLKIISKNKLWVNPDCGLKTRSVEETISALKNMVDATKNIRKKIN
ncbi:5-methyltetrahydropteroyltriglutamate--homocysteine S-methyltransferase [Buchnera aphidicola (Taiwanaphis decaspermi)]|uniref:5-methyltetrahydropteroyltriglutamate-- homocysteine S-methyltransferase n=1 Tax=Buchnera aphidicola TaxID=9 RepID=UPI0031B8AC58